MEMDWRLSKESRHLICRHATLLTVVCLVSSALSTLSERLTPTLILLRETHLLGCVHHHSGNQLHRCASGHTCRTVLYRPVMTHRGWLSLPRGEYQQIFCQIPQMIHQMKLRINPMACTGKRSRWLDEWSANLFALKLILSQCVKRQRGRIKVTFRCSCVYCGQQNCLKEKEENARPKPVQQRAKLRERNAG